MDVTDTSEQPAKSSKDEPDFDPSRMIGIIKRKALIKELAAAYHAECLACCQKLLQLQRKWEEVAHTDLLGSYALEELFHKVAVACLTSFAVSIGRGSGFVKVLKEQQYIKRKTPQESGKHTTKPSKRPKKGM